MKSARPATRKGPYLRNLVQARIAKAQHTRRILELVQDEAKAAGKMRRYRRLFALHKLTTDSDVVEQWTDVVVYPWLRTLQPQLRRSPEIAKMKKAFEHSGKGKFRLSRLKPVVRIMSEISPLFHRRTTSVFGSGLPHRTAVARRG